MAIRKLSGNYQKVSIKINKRLELAHDSRYKIRYKPITYPLPKFPLVHEIIGTISIAFSRVRLRENNIENLLG